MNENFLFVSLFFESTGEAMEPEENPQQLVQKLVSDHVRSDNANFKPRYSAPSS